MGLETEADEFMMLFKRHLNGSMQAQIRWVTCKSVDWDAKTMEAEGVSDELAYYDVALGFGSVDIKPAAESDCLIAILEGQESVAFLIYAVEAELMEFNGGTNGGLVKLQELTDSLNSLKTYCETLKTAIEAGFTSVGIGAAANGTTAKLAFDTAMTSATIEIKDLENDKITH